MAASRKIRGDGAKRRWSGGPVATLGEMISATARYWGWYYQFAFEQRVVDVSI